MLTKEDLKDKYIKYDPSITEEIFNKIISKVESLGIPKHDDAFENDYYGFVKYGLKFYGYNTEPRYGWVTPGNVDGLTKIQVSDIIGTQFEVGKWYKLPNTSNYIVKYESDGRCSEYITTEKKHRRYSSKCNYKDAVEVSLEEIQQYLPEGHVDKVHIQEWGNNTWVVCIKEYASYFKVGDVAQIKVTNAYGLTGDCVDICDYVGIPCYPFKSHCKWFATKEEAEAFSKELLEPKTEEFRIGDYVVVTKQNIPANFAQVGYIGKLLFIGGDKSYFYVDHPEMKDSGGSTCHGVRKASQAEIDGLVKSKEPNMEEKFEIGDWITITKSDENWAEGRICEFVGKTVQVTKTYNEGNQITFDNDDGWTWKFSQGHFRKATSEEIKAVTKVSTPEPKEFALPEKWCVKVTEKNAAIIGSWRTAGSCSPYGYCLYHGYRKGVKGYWEVTIPDGVVEIPFEQFEKHVLNKTEVKKEYDLSTTITRAVKEDNPNLIFEEAGITEVTGLKNESCILDNSNIGNEKSKLGCKGLGCNECIFNEPGGKTIESATAWLYRDRTKSKYIPEYDPDWKLLGSLGNKYSIAEVPVRVTVGKSVKQKVRNTPSIEKVTNRLKASPIIKRSLPEIY